MPEGPEVWILAKVLNLQCYGKHLYVGNEDWSFGLSGTVNLSDNNTLTKIDKGYLPGTIQPRDNNQFVNNDWMTADKDTLERIIKKWKNSNVKLGSLLLNQREIAGIGVAWGSEILYQLGLRPDIKACQQNICEIKFTQILLEYREKIQSFYDTYSKTVDTKTFVNSWFKNLYEQRNMCVYKKGTQIESGGRKWWI